MKGQHAVSLKHHRRQPTEPAPGSDQQRVFARPQSEPAAPGKSFLIDQPDSYAILYKSAPLGCVLLDETGYIRDVNPSAEKIFGLKASVLEGRRLAWHVVASDRDAFHAHLRRVFTHGNEVTKTLKIASTVHGVLDVELRSIQVESPCGQQRICVCTLSDVSERKHLEYEVRRHRTTLARTGRLSIVGEMAAGIAHEINQPLAVVLTYTQICLKMIASGRVRPEEFRDILVKVAEQANHAGAVIRRIRDFIRNEEALPQPVDINAVVDEALALVEPETRKQAVIIEVVKNASLPLVSADALQLEQVIVNVIYNAIEAMNDVGTQRPVITVATRNVGGNRPVQVTVRDTGTGVRKGDEDIIFEPFFTTKPKGMGLGLSLSRSIVEAHGGRMWCEPNEEGGSRFHFILPAVEGGCDDRQSADRIYRR